MKTFTPLYQTVGTSTAMSCGIQPTTCDFQDTTGYAHYVGQSQSQIERALVRLNYHMTQFAHWLYVYELGLVLSFSHQICIKVGVMSEA